MKRNGAHLLLAWAVSVFFSMVGAGADSCRVDSDCGDGVDCNGIETCGHDGQCRPGIGLCGTAAGLPGTSVTASSSYGGGYPPSNMIDGVDESGSSWCTAPDDPAPSAAITWALDVEVREIRVLTSWSPGYDFLTGRLRLLDASGAVVFDSGIVALTGGEVTVPVTPAATGVRRLEMTGETWSSNSPCLSEIEVEGALPCVTDTDCAFTSPCVAVGICLPTGTCSATAPRCRNLALSHAGVVASSTDLPYVAGRAVDGEDSAASSWCASGGTPPTFTLTLPNEHPVDRIRVTAPWTGYELRTGLLTITDTAGAILFDPGTVTFDRGAVDLVVDPAVSAAHVIRLQALTTLRAPCVGELEVLGESCGISVTEASPLTIAFRPGTPTPDFELRYGHLEDLRADGGFDRAACLGRYTAESVLADLPDPEPGEGYYLIGRGFNVCAAEGFGMSRVTPDPRAALAATPACQP